MPERVSRVSAGIAVKASTMPGITKCCQVPVPEIGRMPSCRPSTIIRISASQKLGIACPTIVNMVTPRSIQVFSRSAARMPSGIEMIKREAQADQAERQRDRQALLRSGSRRCP